MKRILVVDDNEDILQVVQLVLELEGYAVKALRSTEDIKQVMINNTPDLLLMAIMLVASDGRDVCRALKADTNHRSIPIILFSASDITRTEALDCGANDFITKPFDLQKLLNTISYLLYK